MSQNLNRHLTDFPETWYNIASDEHFWFVWRFQILKKMLIKNCCLSNDSKCIDVGTGNGLLRTQLISHLKLNVNGTDIDKNLERYHENIDGNFYIDNVFSPLDKLKNKYDIVFLCDVIEHVLDDVDFLNAIKQYMTPNAILVINVPALNFLHSRYDQAVGHIRRYNKKILKKALADSGYKIMDSTYWGTTLIPFLILRKFSSFFIKDNRIIIEKGLKPQNLLYEYFFNRLKDIELNLIQKPVIGASITTIAST